MARYGLGRGMPEAMSQVLVNCGLFLLLTAIGIVFARGRVQWSWLMIALGLYILQDGALSLGWHYFDLDIINSPWNWEGRVLLLVILLLVAFTLFRHDEATTGLSPFGTASSPIRATLLTLILLGLTGAAAYTLSAGRVETDTMSLAYQASLPSITDELLYRGLMLGALDRAFGKPMTILGTPMGWGAVMTAVLFTAAQSLATSPDYVMTLNMSAAAYFFPAALMLAWIRNASGSIYLPIMIHSWANVSVFVI